jgi:transposase-like protein
MFKEIEEALIYADKRKRLGKLHIYCPECKSDQLQLKEWIVKVQFKCRKCKKVIDFKE